MNITVVGANVSCLSFFKFRMVYKNPIFWAGYMELAI